MAPAKLPGPASPASVAGSPANNRPHRLRGSREYIQS